MYRKDILRKMAEIKEYDYIQGFYKEIAFKESPDYIYWKIERNRRDRDSERVIKKTYEVIFAKNIRYKGYWNSGKAGLVDNLESEHWTRSTYYTSNEKEPKFIGIYNEGFDSAYRSIFKTNECSHEETKIAEEICDFCEQKHNICIFLLCQKDLSHRAHEFKRKKLELEKQEQTE